VTALHHDDEELVRFGAAPRPAQPALDVDLASPRPICPAPVDTACPASSPVARGSVVPPTSETLRGVRQRAQVRVDVPRHGWRRLLYRCTGINPGPSLAELEHRRTVDRLTASFTGPRHILFANPKGGAGKTTTCLGVAGTFGQHRGRGVVAFDNNPTRGTLGLRSQSDTHQRTVTDLLADLPTIRQVGDLSAYTRSQPEGHFEVLASDEDPRMAVARDESDYVAVMGVLDTFYKVICVDTGNDVTAPVFTAAVATSDQLVVVTGASWDDAYSASWMLDHLEQHGAGELVRRAVTVVTLPRGRSADIVAIDEHFAARTRAVHHVPFDRALEVGAEISLDALRPRTRRAWLDIAAAIADGFPTSGAPAADLQEDL
jgi:MinD-like ATPase involved in chromosome partitioning or flagellar assembly